MKPHCPYCKSTQLDLIAVNLDSLKCRSCGKVVTGLQIAEQRAECAPEKS